MARIITFMLIFTGIALLFNISGLINEDAMPGILGFALNPQSLLDSDLNLRLITEGLLAVAGVIFVGFLTKNVELAAMAPIAIFVLDILLDFIQVFLTVRAENEVIALLIFGPIFIILFMTIIDWWRGRDS